MTVMIRIAKSVVILVAASGVLLSACTTLDPYTQEEKTSNAAKGAMIGAAAGAAVGLLSGDDSAERKKRALIGAGVGAVAGETRPIATNNTKAGQAQNRRVELTIVPVTT